MSDQHLTTVQREYREQLRIVECAAISDPCSIGEEVARYPAGTSLTVVRAEMVRLAMESRGVDYSIDVFCHRGFWERFVSVRYEAGWEVQPETGIILSGRDIETPKATEADIIERERVRFEHDRAKRQAAHNREKGRDTAGDRSKRTATNH